MADVIVTLRLMPISPEVNLDELKGKADTIIQSFEAEIGKTIITPIAFGIKALDLIFVRDEKLGSTEAMEKQIEELEDVNSAEVIDVRRALG
ncbi:elongation factor 1-beta [Candidatus Woesearchaeota archaeon]|nr:elongation factor 1-beta [Candidatus Woesearchaeota archaeon]